MTLAEQAEQVAQQIEFVFGQHAYAETIRQCAAALARQQAVKGEPLFWVRFTSAGFYEGPIHNAQIEKVRKESGVWTPLYASPPSREPLTPQAVEALVIAAGYEYGVLDPERAAFTAGIRCGERAHGIHSRGEGEKA